MKKYLVIWEDYAPGFYTDGVTVTCSQLCDGIEEARRVAYDKNRTAHGVHILKVVEVE